MKALHYLLAVVAAASLAGRAHAQSPAETAPPPGAHMLGGHRDFTRPATAYFGFGWIIRNESRPMVTRVDADSPASAAGLRVGDVILSVDSHDTLDPPMFRNPVPGRRYALRVARGRETVDLVIVAAPVPAKP